MTKTTPSSSEITHGEEAATSGRRNFLMQALASVSAASLLASNRYLARANHASNMMSTQATKNSVAAMAAAAEKLLKSLRPEQRDKLAMTFEHENRFDWHFIPRTRQGLPLKELDPAQRQLARALLSTGLSQQGVRKAETIIELETVLREIEQGSGPVRDPELYYFSVFGQPRSAQPWGWRVEGHHMSLNYTVAPDNQVAYTPTFFGCNPAEVRHGARKGLRTLPGEEDKARALLMSLDNEQRAVVIVSPEAPRDILSSNKRQASPLEPAGLAWAKMSGKQQEAFMALLNEYVMNMPREIATRRLERLQAAGMTNIHFAWAGGPERGQAHYYRIQGPSFLVEYDNIQNNANHIHTVWRDFNGDFGQDLLAQHYRKSHHHHPKG